MGKQTVPGRKAPLNEDSSLKAGVNSGQTKESLGPEPMWWEMTPTKQRLHSLPEDGAAVSAHLSGSAAALQARNEEGRGSCICSGDLQTSFHPSHGLTVMVIVASSCGAETK